MDYKKWDKKKIWIVVGILVVAMIVALFLIIHRASQPTFADNNSEDLWVPIDQLHTNCTGVQELLKERGIKNVHIICDKEEINKTLKQYLSRRNVIEKFNAEREK